MGSVYAGWCGISNTLRDNYATFRFTVRFISLIDARQLFESQDLILFLRTEQACFQRIFRI